MELQLEDPAEEIKRLRRCINDLVSVIALPAIWSGSEPAEMVRTLLEVLLKMLDLDLIYVRLEVAVNEAPIEMVRVGQFRSLTANPQKIGELFNRWLGDDPRTWPPRIRKTIKGEEMMIVPLRMGLQGEMGFIVAASQRADFPQQTEGLVLSVAANQAAIGLQEARLLSEQKRVAGELDQRVAQRTTELAAANAELKKEIAERMRAENALQASERDLNHIINTIPVLAWCNFPDGSNEFLNQPWHDYTGLTPKQARGWGWQTAIHPDDLPKVLGKWREHLASGKPGEVEARLRRVDGVYRWFLFRANPLRDESGEIVKWYGTNTDIDDRKRAEEELRRNEAFLAEAQHLSQVGSFS